MNKFIIVFAFLFMTNSSFALSQKYFKDNTDINIKLSHSNYNRIFVQNDKITKAYFPEDSLIIKNDEDGSLYVVPRTEMQFTIFLTTQKGHHLSATISSSDALGETIEFIPYKEEVKPERAIQSKPDDSANLLLKSMQQKKSLPGFFKKRHFGKVKRLSKNITAIPKATYKSAKLKGDVIEIYNSGKHTVILQESFFKTKATKAIYIDNLSLKPGHRSCLYLVEKAYD